MDKIVNEIIKDRKSGSTKIIKKTLELLKKAEEKDRDKICRKVISAFPSMSGLKFIAECINKMQIEEIIEKIEDMNSMTSAKLSNVVDGKIVATLSRSHIVEKGLLSAKKINILESMPAKEGIEMAKWLKERGKEVEIFHDAFMSYAVKKCDLVVVGADTLLKDGFVNKTGSLPLALLAKYFKKEFYVASPSYKISESVDFDETFEFVSKNLVTAIVWEDRISNFDELFTKQTLMDTCN